MAYCSHKKGKHYENEKDDWYKGYIEFLNSDNPWNYDFEKGSEGYKKGTHYEQSILSQIIFNNLFSKCTGLDADIEKCGESIIVIKDDISKSFLFDVMHNPKTGCQPCQQAQLFNYNNGKMKFGEMYHTIGNFTPVPRTIISKNYGPRLQQIHEYLNELWPWFLKFLQDNWVEFPTELSSIMSFRDYMKYTCQQMYFTKIFNSLYETYNPEQPDWENIVSKLSNLEVDSDDTLLSFDTLFKSGNIEEIDKRIMFLIELRGRYIISLLKK